MTLSRIEDCDLETLKYRLHMDNIVDCYTKRDCIAKLKERQILLIDKISTTKYKRNNPDAFIHNSEPFRGTPSKGTRDFTFAAPTPVADINALQYRRYKPVSSANDSLVSNQLVLGSLDVYHQITAGPFKINVMDKIYEHETRLNELKAHTELIKGNVSYTPIINLSNVNDSANIDYIETDIKILDQKVLMNMKMYFNEIHLNGPTFYITLPYELDQTFYSSTEYVMADIIVHYDYKPSTDNFRRDSSLSHAFIKVSEPTILKIDSSLLICLSNHDEFFIDEPRFKININFEYQASNIDVHNMIHAQIANVDELNSNILDFVALDPI